MESLSWGTDVKSAFLENAFDNAHSAGLVIIASAGNKPTGIPIYPVTYPSVIGVGALNPDGDQWLQSNYGELVSLYAPGVTDMPIGHNGDPGTYAGTSISTALVANTIWQTIQMPPSKRLPVTCKTNINKTKLSSTVFPYTLFISR